MNYKKKENNNFAVFLTKGVILSYVITIVFFVFFALLMTYTNLAERTIPTINSVIIMVSIVVGSMYIAIKTNKNGWLNGTIVGVVYILILMILRWIVLKDVVFDTYIFVKIIMAVITGAVGGMIGINIK